MNARKSQENSLSHLDVNYVSLAKSHAFDNDLQQSELLTAQQQGSSPTLTLITSKVDSAGLNLADTRNSSKRSGYPGFGSAGDSFDRKLRWRLEHAAQKSCTKSWPVKSTLTNSQRFTGRLVETA
ncbi:uncharacterized protein LOC133835160 [Drosophila sulfurigaster albostrigata]|uniref:uncharacterized protein LOC133835160 n=1 Tax=Drosophila sulfurigaster albostrigata TaxID=89887 RepID=UPI002D21DF0B|nr:uncharacterized protein LOC133835160 [Drosophila sulfurigaster albostrigata]